MIKGKINYEVFEDYAIIFIKKTQIYITDKTDMLWILEISKNDNYIKKSLKLEDSI